MARRINSSPEPRRKYPKCELRRVSSSPTKNSERRAWSLTERFRIISVLHNNHKYVVFHAVERRGPLNVAVKLRKSGSIRKEMHFLRRLRGHPNIVSLCDSSENLEWISLSFARRGDLLTRLQNTEVSESFTRHIVRGVLRGLWFCHCNGIIHLDMKPENIVLMEADRPVICDFDLSREISTTWKKLPRNGTPPYLSPEVLRNHSVIGPEVDIWGLGHIMLVCLSRLLIYSNYVELRKDNFATIEARINALLPPSVSEPARRLVHSLLKERPFERHTHWRIARSSFVHDPEAVELFKASQTAKELVLDLGFSQEEFHSRRSWATTFALIFTNING